MTEGVWLGKPDADPDHDYVTLEQLAGHDWWIVIVMVYHQRDDEYIQGRVSQPLHRAAADALAQSWATAKGILIR